MDVEDSESSLCSASSEPQSGRIESSYVSALVAKTVGIMEGGVRHADTTAVSDIVLNEVEDCLKEFHELFSDADEGQQSDMISEILSVPKNLHTYYNFADKVYQDRPWDDAGNINSCYSLILSNIASWTDSSDLLAHEINTQGLLLVHIEHLLKLQLKEDELDLAVVEKTTMEMLTIIHNCVRDPDLQHFYFGNTINWTRVLSPWIHCSHSTLRMQARFVLGYLRSGLTEDDLELLNMDKNDWNIFMTMFVDCCQPPDFVATMVGNLAPIIQQLSQIAASVVPGSMPSEDDVMSELSGNLKSPVESLSISENEMVASFSTEENSYVFSASEIMNSLENLLSTDSNLQAFHSYTFLPHLQGLLNHGGTEEKVAVCKLLWSLAGCSPVIQAELKTQGSTLTTGLKLLHTHRDLELQLLSKCIAIKMHRGDGEETLMLYVRNSYKYRKYHECIEHCKKMEHLAEAKIYLAKALYRVYTQEQVLLRAKNDDLTPRMFHQKHEACYSKAKKVIGLLGRFLDEGEKLFDHECSQMLDVAMMDYIYETNKLRDTQRCFLCRSTEHLGQSPGEEVKEEVSDSDMEVTDSLSISAQELTLSSTDDVHQDLLERQVQVKDTDTANVQESLLKLNPLKSQSKESSKAKHKQGLQASHLFPAAIIKRFVRAVPLAKGKRVCTIKGIRSFFDSKNETLHSSGEATLYMLCHNCEELLSKSESWFIRHFFSKVYDENNPSQTKDEQSIPYSEHLFKFCVSMVFRLLNHDSTAILNHDEVYHLLEQCRAVLQPESVSRSVKKPDIYFLMSPTGEDEEEYGLINQFLTSTMSRMFGLHHLDTALQLLHSRMSSFAHFVVIHMGILNILVKFQPSSDYEIDPRFRILPDGGVYSVPHNSKRKELIPPGMYTLFQVHAMEMEKKWLEGPSLTYDPLEDPDKNVSEMFGILKAEAKDESRIISEKRLTHVSAEYPRTLCFLPPGFDVSPPITVPKDHTILLHHTHGDAERGLVLFLCIGYNTDDGYGVDKPYVITYHYQPGYELVSCFFISLEDMQPIGFLPNTRGISTVKNQDEILRDTQQKDYASVIECTLKEKGFHSLKSLICRLVATRKLPLVDAQCTPCSVEEVKRCCYCANRCDRCFKTVPKMAISLEGPEESDLDFKFCSTKCYQISIEPPTSDCYYLVDSKGNLNDIGGKSNHPIPENFSSFCGPIAPNHTNLLHIYFVGTNWAGYRREDEIALCVGTFERLQEQLYVVYHGRSLTGQLCLEFFVSDDLSPSHPVPHLQNEDATEQVKGLKDDEVIQPHLLQIIGVISSITGCDISLTTSSLLNDLPSALSMILTSHNDRFDD